MAATLNNRAFPPQGQPSPRAVNGVPFLSHKCYTCAVGAEPHDCYLNAKHHRVVSGSACSGTPAQGDGKPIEDSDHQGSGQSYALAMTVPSLSEASWSI